MSEMKVRVREIRQEAIDVKSFVLVDAGGATLPSFSCGSHIDVNVGGVVRQYSLCNVAGGSDHYRIAVKREPESRGGSRLLHDDVHVDDVLIVSAPRNNFELDRDAGHTLLLAGGIGITPLLSMATTLKSAGASFQLQYFTRSIAHTAFHEELSRPDLAEQVTFHYALEPSGLKAYLRKLLWHHDAGAHLYLCGPRPFMDLVQDTAAATWPPENVHLEYFAADSQSLAGPQQAFDVRLARSGKSCRVDEGQSIVQALLALGIEVPTSCEQGVCGTCLTGVLAGTPDHRDVVLSDEERAAGDKIMPCVSRARSSSITLDL